MLMNRAKQAGSYGVLCAPSRQRKTKTAQADYDQRNLESARLILADPDSHGGRESFAVIWAKTVLERFGVAE